MSSEASVLACALTLRSLLLDHMRKFPVSATGALMLTKYVFGLSPQRGVCQHIYFPPRDIKSYQDAIAGFGIPALFERFEFLRQLGNIYLIPPETLKSYITENYLGRVDAELLKPYLALRSDWGSVEKGFAATPGLDGAAPEAEESRSRFGRLSVMMKELEGLKLTEGINMPAMPAMPGIPSSLTGNFTLNSLSAFR